MEKKAKTAMLSKRRPKGQAAGTSLASVRVVNEAALLADLRSLIRGARDHVASVANSAQTMLYWYVGRRLLKENLQEGRVITENEFLRQCHKNCGPSLAKDSATQL